MQISRRLRIKSAGLHAKPASIIFKKIHDLGIPITIQTTSVRIEGPSIMTLLALGLTEGSEIVFITNKENENELDELINYLENYI